MNGELDKLAAAMKNIRPSKASRKRGTKAAMAAFDGEFAREVAEATEVASEKKSHTSQRSGQGLAAAPRLTGQTTHSATRTARVQTFGRDMMKNIRKFVNIKPQTLVMGGTSMAAILAALVYFQVDRFDTGIISPAVRDTIVESKTEVPTTTPAIEPPIVKTRAGDETPDVPPVSPAVSKIDVVAVDTVEALTSTPAKTTITPAPETPSNVVVIERRILKTPASIQERVVPPITKQVSRRVIATTGITIERIIPEVTKQVTRRVKADDGTVRTISETVVVRPQSIEYITPPSEYETVQETVIVQEASTELVTVPAVYETVRETIAINADGSTNVLKSETVPASLAPKSAGGITSINSLLSRVGSDTATGEAKTRAEVFRSRRASKPSLLAKTKDEVVVTGARSGSSRASTGVGIDTLTGIVPAFTPSSPSSDTTDAPARMVERVIPAITKQVTRRVIKMPTGTLERVIPAITKEVTVRVKTEDGTYKNVTKIFVTQEASTELIIVPSVYETITETVVVMPASTEMVILNADGSIASRTLIVKRPKPEPKPMPQSGRLTAGDYDDVLNPGLYKVYLDKMLQGPLKGKDLPYVDANRRISIRVVDRLGKAVPMADISLKSADNKTMVQLRTGADGLAYLYPGFDNLKSGTKIKISVKGARSVKKTLTKKLIKNGGEIVVDLKTNRQAIESLDLLLTIDATGSMGDEMRYLQSELKAIVGRVEVANPGIDIRTGLIVYRDKGDAYIIREIPFTDDLEDFRKSLSEQNANGGGDTPEAMHLAMQAGLKMNWRKDALKVNLLVADAPPHDQYISDTWEAGLISRSRGIHIVPLAASGVDKTAEFLMRSMAQITGGRFLFLTDDSGIGNPHAEPSVDCYVVTRLDGLVTRVLSSLIKGERVEPGADDVIRSVGNYRSGICALESQEANVSPQNATLRDEQ